MCYLGDTPEHTAHLAVLKAVSHFTTALLSDIDIHSLVASYKHEAGKKILSAFYYMYIAPAHRHLSIYL
jgi:hypothetical protein